MGLFTEIGNIWAKSNSAIIVENYLRQHEPSLPPEDSKAMASICVNKSWEIYPDVFDGKYGQRPHKIVIALVGMTQVINSTERNHQSFQLMLLSTVNLYRDILANSELLPLKNIDYKMIETITPIIEDEIADWEEKNKSLINTMDRILKKDDDKEIDEYADYSERQKETALKIKAFKEKYKIED